MPSLSVHQQKAHKKHKPRRTAASTASAAAPHPTVLAAEQWLADRSSAPSAPDSIDSLLSPALFAPSYIESARAAYSSAAPFPHFTIRPLLDDSYCRHLLAICKLLHFTHRRADLYRFDQSEDLKAVQSPLVARLRSLLYGQPFRALLQSITGVAVSGSLDATVSMSCAAYSATHRLLCHDDELQGRRIAYILYLVPDDWSEADGGQLDLFDSQQPNTAHSQQHPHSRPVPLSSPSSTRSLLPAFNAFTFFEVTPRSFHAVREVLSSPPQTGEEGAAPRVRVSISGWFHGEQVYPPSQPHMEDELGADGSLSCLPPLDSAALLRLLSAVAPAALPSARDVLSLSHWLSADYCKPAVCRSVAAHFQDESSVELHHFLQPARYQQLLRALQLLADSSQDEDGQPAGGWQRSGPLNRRHYSSYTATFRWTSDEVARQVAERRTPAAATTAASSAAACLLLDDFSLFLRSSVFLSWLQSCTGGLRVAALRGEYRRFASGDYTLALDDDSENSKEALDVTLCVFDREAVKQVRQRSSASSGSSGGSSGRGNKARQRLQAAEWDEEWGGSIHYIAAGAEDELLCSQPAANTLTLVYRTGSSTGQQQHGEEKPMVKEEEADGGECIRFTEYVTHQCPTPRYDVDLVCRLQEEEHDNQ